MQKLFLGTQAFDLDHGLTDSTPEIAQAKRAMIRAAREVILLTDSSKWGRAGFVKVAPLSDIDTIINGHTSANTTPADMSRFADYVADFVAHVQAAKKAGKTPAQAVAEWKNPEKYTGFSAPNPERATAYAQVIFDETK